jgi:hypothetical protein
MKVLIRKILRSPLFKELLKAMVVAALEAVAATERKSTRSRPGAPGATKSKEGR